MESLIFAFNAVTPIIAMVAIGYFLKRAGVIGQDFIKTANRLVFRLFLPVMLFSNVYKIENIGEINLWYVAYAIGMLAFVFVLSVISSGMVTKEKSRRGVLIQGVFRSNYALIGIPLSGSLFGDEGVTVASVLSAFAIPAFNVLAVIALTVFGKGEGRPSIKSVLADIAKNPMIQGVAAGFCALIIHGIFVQNGIGFRLFDIEPAADVIGYLAGMATPMALMVLGAQFEFSAVASLKKEIIFGTLMRSAVVPLLGIGTAFLLFREDFSGAHFAAFVAMFTTPVAVSSVPMAQEMGGDSTLAGQLVVWTTLSSAVTIFVMSFWLKAAGIF